MGRAGWAADSKGELRSQDRDGDLCHHSHCPLVWVAPGQWISHKDRRNTKVNSVPDGGWERGVGTVMSSSLGRQLARAGVKGITPMAVILNWELPLYHPCAIGFIYTISHFPHIALGGMYYYPHFSDEETEAYQDQLTGLKSLPAMWYALHKYFLNE